MGKISRRNNIHFNHNVTKSQIETDTDKMTFIDQLKGQHFVMQEEIPFLPVFSSMRRLLRYSLGSVALGSLVVFPVESVRFILESLRRRLKFADTTYSTQLGRVTSASSQCCLGCIDWTIKSVNRNAYIMVSF